MITIHERRIIIASEKKFNKKKAIIVAVIIAVTLTTCAGCNRLSPTELEEVVSDINSNASATTETQPADMTAEGSETDGSTPETTTETTETTETTAEATTPATGQTTPEATTETEAPKPETTTTTTTTTTAATPQSTEAPAPEWTETAVSGTKYVTVDCYSRANAIVGSERVKLYKTNTEVKVVARTNTGYFKLSDGSFIHGDYLSDSKVTVQTTTTTTTQKSETPKPADTTTKKQESKPKSIYEYPFDLEAIKQVIVNDAVNNYGLKNLEDPTWTPEGSTWNAPLVISYDLHPNVIKRNVTEEAGANFRVAQMKKGDYFKVYIQDISEDLDVRDENGKLTKAYAIYFLRG